MRKRFPLAALALAVLATLAAGPTPAAGRDANADAGFANTLTVHNKGVGGQNSTAGRARFQRDVVALKPDFVFIYFGLNDTLNEKAFVDLADFIANLDAMIAAAREAGITPVLATIHHVDVDALLQRHPRHVYGDEGPQAKIDRYNVAIRKLAAERKVALNDWCAAADGMRDAWRHRDGVHLTAIGNAALARSFHAAARTLRDGQTVVCLGDSVTFGAHATGAGTATGTTYPAELRRIPLPRAQ